jgi:membrane-bound ClpP family serine protease
MSSGVLRLDGSESSRHGGAEDEKSVKKRRQNLTPFVLFSLIEETAIGAAALLAIVLLVPQLMLPGVISVAIGLAAFTVVKIHYFLSSAALPVEDVIVGQVVRVRDNFQPSGANVWTGRIQVRGESWLALAREPIPKGSKVRVTGIEGLRLDVVRILFDSDQPASATTVNP